MNGLPHSVLTVLRQKHLNSAVSKAEIGFFSESFWLFLGAELLFLSHYKYTWANKCYLFRFSVPIVIIYEWDLIKPIGL